MHSLKEAGILVLSRRSGEEIVIDGGIRIKVVSTNGDRVRLGIEAPEDVRVDRAEIHERRLEFSGASARSGAGAGCPG